VALDMLQGERRTQEGRTEVLEGQVKDDVAITPLAIPMLAGPGAISTVIVLSSQARGPTQTAIVYGAIVLTGLISFIALRVGEPLLTRLGKTGVRVVTRIMGLLLAAVAVQFVLSGVKEALVAK
jgi:multiple antibiotic resistance protein